MPIQEKVNKRLKNGTIKEISWIGGMLDGHSACVTCPKCRGYGAIEDKKCNLCDGHKSVRMLEVMPDDTVERLLELIESKQKKEV